MEMMMQTSGQGLLLSSSSTTGLSSHHHLLQNHNSNSSNNNSHPALKPSVKGERRYPCGYPGCKWVFTRSNHVLRHHQRVHPGYSRHSSVTSSMTATTATGSRAANAGASQRTSRSSNSISATATTMQAQDLSFDPDSMTSSSNQSVPSNPRVTGALTTPSANQSEADRFRELMSRSLIRCDEPDCDQTFKSPAALSRHKTTIHPVVMTDSGLPDGEEEDEENTGLEEGNESEDMLPPGLAGMTPAELMRAIAAAARPSVRRTIPHVVPQSNRLPIPVVPQTTLPIDAQADNKPFTCPVLSCHKSFWRRDHLKRHQSQAHHHRISHSNQNQIPISSLTTKPVSSSVILEEDVDDDYEVHDDDDDDNDGEKDNGLEEGEMTAEEMQDSDQRSGVRKIGPLTASSSSSFGPSPRKKARLTHPVILEDEETTNVTHVLVKHRRSQSKGTAKGRKEEAEGDEENGSGGEGNGRTTHAAVRQDSDGKIQDNDVAEDDDEDEEDDEFGRSAALILPAVAMEPEVLLQVDEDTVWTPTPPSPVKSKGQKSMGKNGQQHGNKSQHQVLGSMDWTRNPEQYSIPGARGHHVDEDENDVSSSSSFPELESGHQETTGSNGSNLLTDHRLMQQLILSRALLSATSGGSAADETAIAIARTMALQQQQQLLLSGAPTSATTTAATPIGKNRPYACDVPGCDKRYTKHSHLVRHKVETHKMQKPEPRTHHHLSHQQQSSPIAAAAVVPVALVVAAPVRKPVPPPLQALQTPVAASSISTITTAVRTGSPFSNSSNHPPPAINLTDRPYVCDFPGCRWSFKRQYHLDRHFLTHRQQQKQQQQCSGNETEDGENGDEDDEEMDEEAERLAIAAYEEGEDGEESNGDIGYENHGPEVDNNDENYVSGGEEDEIIASDGHRGNGSHEANGGTSLLSPLNLKTSGSQRSIDSYSSPLSRQQSQHLQKIAPRNPSVAVRSHQNSSGNTGLKNRVTATSSMMASSASALINATTGAQPSKINTTTPGNFTCCFPGCGIKCQSQSSFDAHLYLNHIVTNPLYNKKNKKSSADLINQTLLLLEQNAILNQCNDSKSNANGNNGNNQHHSSNSGGTAAGHQQRVSKNNSHNNSNPSSHHNNNIKCPPNSSFKQQICRSNSSSLSSSTLPTAYSQESQNHRKELSNSHISAKNNKLPYSSISSNNHNNNNNSHRNNRNSNSNINNNPGADQPSQGTNMTMVQAYSLSLANLMHAVSQRPNSSPSPSSPSHTMTTTANNSTSSHFPSIQCLPSPESSSSSPSDAEYSAGGQYPSPGGFTTGDRKGEKALFTCDIEGCDKKFGRNCELTRHKLNHMDVWPFSCDHAGCGRKFKRKDVFKNHLRTHVKEYSSSSSSPPMSSSHTASSAANLVAHLNASSNCPPSSPHHAFASAAS